MPVQRERERERERSQLEWIACSFPLDNNFYSMLFYIFTNRQREGERQKTFASRVSDHFTLSTLSFYLFVFMSQSVDFVWLSWLKYTPYFFHVSLTHSLSVLTFVSCIYDWENLWWRWKLNHEYFLTSYFILIVSINRKFLYYPIFSLRGENFQWLFSFLLLSLVLKCLSGIHSLSLFCCWYKWSKLFSSSSVCFHATQFMFRSYV